MAIFKNTTTNEILTEHDPKVTLRETIKTVNVLSDKLKNRNLVGDERKQVEQTRSDLLLHALQLTAGAIQFDQLASDEYGFLRANVSKKTFKDSGRINAILKGHIANISKEQADKTLNDIELAKLMETPFQMVDVSVDEIETVTAEEVVEEAKQQKAELDRSKFDDKGIQEVSPEQVPTPNDSTVIKVESNHKDDTNIIVDKEEKVAYVEQDGKTFAKDLDKDGEGAKWYQKAKDILVGAFGYLWDKFLDLAKALFQFAMGALNLLLATIMIPGSIAIDTTCVAYKGTKKGASALWNSVTGLFGKKEKKEEKNVPSNPVEEKLRKEAGVTA